MKNKKAVLGLAALAAVAVIGGTWAYWNQDLSAVNEFETGQYDTEITETFTPPTPGEWVPGVEVEKKVTVTNKGNVKLAALATINQVWVRTENVIDTSDDNKENPIPPKAGDYFDLMFENDGKLEYASIVSWGKDVVALDSVSDAAAGMGIMTTVSGLDAADAAGKWVMVKAENTADENGKETNSDGKGFSDVQFIYNGIIEAKGTEGKDATPMLLEGATLNKAINTTITAKKTTTSVDKDGNTVTTTETTKNAAFGYDSAKYTMTINATTVQATKSAIQEIFGAKKVTEEQINAFLDVNKDNLMAEEKKAETSAAPTTETVQP